MVDLQDIRNRSIRLTDERLHHLETDHPEMIGQISRIAETLADPDWIIRSRTDATVELFDRWYTSTPVTAKFLCVVIKALPDDPFMITAYHTDAVKRGEVLWEKR
jgi:hypothetical protein